MTAKEYREVYLRSDHWRQMRREALERAENRCQVCNTQHGLDVHHRTYERLGGELPADLTVLCRRCHDLFHKSLAKRRDAKAPRTPKALKAQSKRQRKAQRKRDNQIGAHARAMAEMKARNARRAT